MTKYYEKSSFRKVTEDLPEHSEFRDSLIDFCEKPKEYHRVVLFLELEGYTVT